MGANTLYRSSFRAIASGLGAAILTCGNALATDVTISATASGSPAPTILFNQDVQNGDFLIWKNPEIEVNTGDGVDETTYWTMDFTSDPDFSSFPQEGKLTSALLLLTVTTPFAPGPPTDYARMGNFVTPLINMPLFLPNGGTGRIEFNLLDLMCGDTLLEDIRNHNFKVPTYYGDDAVVSFARIILTAHKTCLGDVDGDEDVDLSDLGVVLSNFGAVVGCSTDGDLNDDGTVNLSDLGILLAQFGISC